MIQAVHEAKQVGRGRRIESRQSHLKTRHNECIKQGHRYEKTDS